MAKAIAPTATEATAAAPVSQPTFNFSIDPATVREALLAQFKGNERSRIASGKETLCKAFAVLGIAGQPAPWGTWQVGLSNGCTMPFSVFVRALLQISKDRTLDVAEVNG